MGSFLGLCSGANERTDQEEAGFIRAVSEADNAVGVAAHDHEPCGSWRALREEGGHLRGDLRCSVWGILVGSGELEGFSARPDVRGVPMKDKASLGERGIDDGVR